MLSEERALVDDVLRLEGVKPQPRRRRYDPPLPPSPDRVEAILSRLRQGVVAWPHRDIPGLWDVPRLDRLPGEAGQPDDFCSSTLITYLRRRGLVRDVEKQGGRVAGRQVDVVVGVEWR